MRVRGWGVGESLGWERDRSERVEEGWGEECWESVVAEGWGEECWESVVAEGGY